jgi:hypothetical protein
MKKHDYYGEDDLKEHIDRQPHADDYKAWSLFKMTGAP